MKVYAPWTPEQVAQLQAWQVSANVHPFTCPRKSRTHKGGVLLVPHDDGWHCSIEGCNYYQNWVHDFMLWRSSDAPDPVRG